MGRSFLIGALAAALAVGGSVAVASTTKPTLRLVHAKPATVRGKGFYAHERVRVTIVGGKKYVRYARTNATGTFTAVFDDVTLGLDRCGNGWALFARGARGDTASSKLPQPECPPSLGP